MKDFVEYIVKNLVEHPDDVKVECFEGERGMIVEIRVHQDDVGKVVGKRGSTINAIRTISMMVCARLGRKVRVELVEDN
ncbi:MAG: KH domain-containing protein [Chlamydiota bacterium]|nr:KH domain-containing protein [Chlamydiota bacterium]